RRRHTRCLSDWSSDVCSSDLTRTLKLINDQQNPQPQAAGVPGSLERKIHEAGGPVELTPISNVPVTLKMLNTKSDVVYRTVGQRSEEHTSELQSLRHLVCRLL